MKQKLTDKLIKQAQSKSTVLNVSKELLDDLEEILTYNANQSNPGLRVSKKAATELLKQHKLPYTSTKTLSSIIKTHFCMQSWYDFASMKRTKG